MAKKEKVKKEKTKKGGGRLLVGIICFVLGFIMAFAAIAGVVCAGLFMNLDSVLGIVGLDNTDEEGNNVYVNTDSENGGVSNAYELISTVVSLAGDYQNLTLGELEDLIPATSVIADTLVEYLVDYISEDADTLHDELISTPVSGLGDYVQEVVSKIRVATVLELVAPDLLGDTVTGVIMSAIVYGTEASYVTVNGVDTPVYYDVYKLENGVYTRYTADSNGDYTIADTSAQITASGSASTLSKVLESSSGGLDSYLVAYGDIYYLYYYVSGSTAYVTDGEFNYLSSNISYSNYDADKATLSGDYYYDGSTRVISNYVTIGDLSDSEYLTVSLNNVAISDLLSGDDNVLSDILGDYTISDLINGDIDFNTIELTALLSAAPSNTAMAIILYDGISAIAQDERGNWTCNYTDDDGNVYVCDIQLDSDGNISKIVYNNGKNEVPSTTVGGISSLVDDLELVSIMDAVSPDDAIMMYIFYGVTNVKQDGSGNWTAQYTKADGEKVTVIIETNTSGDSELVSYVYYEENGKKISTATTINSVSDIVSGIQDELEIVSLLGDVEADDAIIMYLSYSVTGAYQDGNGDWHGYITEDGVKSEVDIAVTESVDEDGETVYIVTGVTYANSGAAVTGTTINDISGVISGMQDELEVASLLGDIEVDDAIMIYLTYSVTGAYQDDSGAWHGYITEDGVKSEVDIAVTESIDGSGEIVYIVSGVTYTNGGASVSGTTIDGISDVISKMQDELEVVGLLGDVEVDDAIMMYLTYSVTGAYQDGNGDWHGYITEDGVKSEVDIAVTESVDEDGEIVYIVSGVTYANGGASVTGTTINGISDVISAMHDDMEVAALLGDVEVDDAIMVYLTYSVTGAHQDKNGDWHGYITEDGVKTDVDIAVKESVNEDGETIYIVTGVTYTSSGASVSGTTINGISDVISGMHDDMEVASLLGDVEVDDAVMVYLTYSITSVYQDDGGAWHGYITENGVKTDVDIAVTESVNEDGETVYIIKSVTYANTDVTVLGTTINGISDVLNKMQDELEIASLLGDIEVDDAIMVYLTYSVFDVYQDDGGAWHGYITEDGVKTDVDISVTESVNEDGETVYIVKSVTYTNGGAAVTGTAINDISSQIDGVKSTIAIGEIIDTNGNAFLEHLSSTTLDGLTEALNSLSLQEVFADSIYTDTVYKKVVTSVSDEDTETLFDSSYTYYTRSGSASEGYTYTLLGEYDTYAELKAAMSDEGVTEVYAECHVAREIYVVTQATFDAAYLYWYMDSDGNYKLANGDGKFASWSSCRAYMVDNSCDVYTYGEPGRAWKLMLYNDGSEVAYSINDVENLMHNVSDNINESSISELTAAGILYISESTLQTEISGRLYSVEGKTYIGELTIYELVSYLTTVLSYVTY